MLRYFLEDGVGDPLAVKAKPVGQKTRAVLSPGSRPGSARTTPLFWSVTARPPAHCRVATRVHANP
jgi:hypothetical protein